MVHVLTELHRTGGAAMVERLLHLDTAALTQPVPQPLAPLPVGAAIDYDVALLGGGLSLLLAPLLARRGLRVAVFDRGRIGTAQREWNASWPELLQLCDVGLCNPLELQALLVSRYETGLCRWHGGKTTHVQGVLDCAVNAQGLLDLARREAKNQGVTLWDNHAADITAAGPHGVQLQVHDRQKPEAVRTLYAATVLDGRGACSPYARTDLVCPTVGGVLEGLDTDPRVGEILVSTEHVEDGHQHLWEAFPGAPGQTTVYLFYYARRQDVGQGALQALYERFFARLPRYKGGKAHLLRPTFGFIPGWSRLGPGPQSPHPRVILIGDAAARHSPLTFCGFGAMLRSLAPLLNTLGANTATQSAVDDRSLHAGTGALAMLMARPPRAPQALNRLLDVAFTTLETMGNPAYAALLQDTMPPRQFVQFLQQVSERDPGVYRHVWRALGPSAMARWGLRMGGQALRG